MTEIIVGILGISVLLYVLLGGADFGAGIIELIIGKRGISTISKAIAPVWEANHIWIILAIVILFNGFPVVYTTLTTFLHIPLLLVLIGIIIRGTAFTFRYYDTAGESNIYYSWFFRVASLLTPFFLGMVFGAIMLGRIPVAPGGSFTDVFIGPWLNVFTLSTGLFSTLLFGWIASVYLVGETSGETYQLLVRTSFQLFVLLIVSGFIVFISAEYAHLDLFKRFLQSYISMLCVVIATIIIPVMWKNIRKRRIFRTRLLAGVLVSCILAGWFAVQFPVMIYIADGTHLTVWNSHAPEKTMFYLLIVLIVGVLIIFPAFAYLFRVFKFDRREST